MKGHCQNSYYYTVTGVTVDDDDDEEDDPPVKRHKHTNKQCSSSSVNTGRAFIFGSKFIEKWLDDEDMLTYDHIDFLPPPLHVPDDVYNTWRGFAVQYEPPATQEETTVMHDMIMPLIRDVICAGKEDAYTWVTNCIAQLFQEPGSKTDMALVLLGEEGCGKTRLTVLLTLMLSQRMAFQTSQLKTDVCGRFANVSSNRLLLVLDELDPKKVSEYYRALMDLVTSHTRPAERKNVQNVLTVANILRVIFSSNDEEALMRVPEKERKWQWVLASKHRRGQVLEYFVPLMVAINTPGVRRAYYDYLMAIDYSGFNFVKQRAHCDLYESSKLNSVKREVRFMLWYVMQHVKEMRDAYKLEDEKRRGVMTVMTGDLFEMFTSWWSSVAAAGKQAEAGANITAFSIAISKIPGCTKNSRHGTGSSYQYCYLKNTRMY
jgi:Family of unknown function (DUF5906)